MATRKTKSRADDPKARAFAVEFRKAIKARGLTHKEFAAQLGCAPNWLSRYSNAHSVPTMDRAIEIADLLMWPAIIDRVKDYASRNCELCGTPFLQVSQQLKKRFCTNACRATYHSRKMRGNDEVKERFGRMRLRVYAERIAAYCKECTGSEGVCREPECELREVSPLPLATARFLDKRSA